MEERITLKSLTQNDVTIQKTIVTQINGKYVQVGEIESKSYHNGLKGREEMIAEVPEPYRSVILLMWGDNPTVIEQ